MKKVLILAGYLASAGLAWPATQLIYENNAPIYACCGITGGVGVGCSSRPPDIDAVIFLNRSIFNVDNSYCMMSTWPYDMQNILFFTNTASGSINGAPGFRYDCFNTALNQRSIMESWVNHGAITGATWIAVWSRNISSSGLLCTGPGGLIRLNGENIDLVRDGLRVGSTPGMIYAGGDTIGTNYYNATGVTDIYWGAGTNNYMDNSGPPMWLNQGNFDLPCIRSPVHAVIYAGSPYTNYTMVPLMQYWMGLSNCSVPYTAYAWTNPYAYGPDKDIQVVFVPTFASDPNCRAEVRFYPGGGQNGGAAAAVAFEMVDYDLVSMGYTTNAVYLVDHGAFVTNNIRFSRPGGGGNNRRPDIYELFRYAPYEFTLGSFPNLAYTNGLIYNPSYLSNRVDMLYAAYAANVAPEAAPTGPIGDPTNFPGRVEIVGDVVNLDRSRVRAESTVLIRARTNLVNNKLARVDAPYLSYDLRSQQSPLFITNLAPATVRRMGGDVYCWTGVWNNYETNAAGGTNLLRFHVLIVDSSLLNLVPVSVFEFQAHATNLVVSDSLTISRTILLDARDLLVTSTLNFPPGSSWSMTNVPQLLNFTNSGMISIPQSADYGSDRASSYWNFINYGTNIAASQRIRTTNFVDTGSLIASGGVLKVQTRTASLLGAPTILFYVTVTNYTGYYPNYQTNIETVPITNSLGAMLLANSDLEIYANELFVSNSIIRAGDVTPGKLVISVTNKLMDSGPDLNEWVAKGGFQMLTRPTDSDLLHTHLTSKPQPFTEVIHYWNAQDRGAADASGFSNNLALGKLTLDGDIETRFYFSAPPGSTNKAMYVDYLEFMNTATNYKNDCIEIATNLTIYVAHANVAPSKLEKWSGGRIRWVPYFAGPFSSTNLTYPSGRVYTFNISLVTDMGLDSDGDGIVNAYDPTPIFVNENVGLSMRMLAGSSRRAIFSWMSLGNAENWLETQATAGGNWEPLLHVTSGPQRGLITITNTVPNEPLRFYRVRLNPPPVY